MQRRGPLQPMKSLCSDSFDHGKIDDDRASFGGAGCGVVVADLDLEAAVGDRGHRNSSIAAIATTLDCDHRDIAKLYGRIRYRELCGSLCRETGVVCRDLAANLVDLNRSRSVALLRNS